MATISAYQTAKGKRYRVRYRTPEHKTTDKRGFRTKRDADLFAASIEVSKARGEFVSASASRATVAELGKAWLPTKEAALKPSMYRTLASAWSVYVEPRWGSVALGMLSTPMWQRGLLRSRLVLLSRAGARSGGSRRTRPSRRVPRRSSGLMACSPQSSTWR